MKEKLVFGKIYKSLYSRFDNADVMKEKDLERLAEITAENRPTTRPFNVLKVKSSSTIRKTESSRSPRDQFSSNGVLSEYGRTKTLEVPQSKDCNGFDATFAPDAEMRLSLMKYNTVDHNGSASSSRKADLVNSSKKRIFKEFDR